MIDAARGGVVRLERHRGRILEVQLAVLRARLIRQGEVLENLLRNRVDQSGRDDVPGERVTCEPPCLCRMRSGRERVVDLILRSEREQIGEVAVAHLRGRHRHDVRRRNLERVRLEIGEVKGVIRPDGAPNGATEAIVLVVALPPPRALVEVVARVERSPAIPFIRLSAKDVRTALRHQVDDGAHRVADCCVVGCRVDLELLDRRRRRAVRHAVVGDV